MSNQRSNFYLLAILYSYWLTYFLKLTGNKHFFIHRYSYNLYFLQTVLIVCKNAKVNVFYFFFFCQLELNMLYKSGFNRYRNLIPLRFDYRESQTTRGGSIRCRWILRLPVRTKPKIRVKFSIRRFEYITRSKTFPVRSSWMRKGFLA